MSMIHTGPSSGKERTMYCGEVVRTHAKASEHFQNCPKCQALRREIRAITCKNLKHTDDMRRKYSETAKKTSKRSDIQQQRATNLKHWRDQNPEQFQKIQAKAHGSPKRSKMEAWLASHLLAEGFTRNSRLSCGEVLKQVDFIHLEKEIVIEIDGPWHFLPVRSAKSLAEVQKRDRMLEREILTRSWRLIRLSMECFKSNSGELISPDLSQLLATVDAGNWTGIRCYGSLYESLSWDGSKVTILK
ncbi:hypothetical protein [Methylomagnum sp.]